MELGSLKLASSLHKTIHNSQTHLQRKPSNHRQNFSMSLLSVPRELRDRVYEHYFDSIAVSPGRLTASSTAQSINRILDVCEQVSAEVSEILRQKYVIHCDDIPGLTGLNQDRCAGLNMHLELPLKSRNFDRSLHNLKTHLSKHLLEFTRLESVTTEERYDGEGWHVRAQHQQLDECFELGKNRLFHMHLGIDERERNAVILSSSNDLSITGSLAKAAG